MCGRFLVSLVQGDGSADGTYTIFEYKPRLPLYRMVRKMNVNRRLVPPDWSSAWVVVATSGEVFHAPKEHS